MLDIRYLTPGPRRPRILLDTDIDGDCDDVAALALLHELADRGEADILAVGLSATHPDLAACVEAVNRYYGRADLPIGAPTPPATYQGSPFARAVAALSPAPPRYPRTADAPDAVELYRGLLEREDDGAATLVTIGELTNPARLLDVPADGRRPSGAELVARKIRLWVCMGGNFIGRPAHDDLSLGNNNFTHDAASAHAAITRWPTPILFAGREMCSVPSGVAIGARFAELPDGHPARVAYAAYFDGAPRDRHVADLATVLAAVRGPRDYWDVETRGAMRLAPDMTFDWDERDPRPMAYLLKRGDADDRRVEETLYGLLLRTPPSA